MNHLFSSSILYGIIMLIPISVTQMTKTNYVVQILFEIDEANLTNSNLGQEGEDEQV